VSYDTKMAWILRLEDRRVLRDPPPLIVPSLAGPVAPSSPAATADLTRLLTDEEARVRRRAALAIGRVGLSDGLPALSTVLARDVEEEVRQMAAFALGLIGDPAAAAALRTALADPSPLVHGRAAEALGRIGDASAAEAIGAMVGARIDAGDLEGLVPDELSHPLSPSIDAARLGLYALARLRAYDALAGAVLDRDGQPRSAWWPVAYALQRAQDARAIPALRALAATPTVYARAFAIRGLGELGDDLGADAVMPVLGDALVNPLVEIEAIRAARRLRLTAAAPALARLAFSGTVPPMVRAEALSALGETGIDDTAVHEGLFDLLSDRSPIVRAEVLSVIARLDRETFVTVLSGMTPDAQWTVRAALARVLGTLPADMAVPRLRAMLDDEDLRVVPPVLQALARLRAPGTDAVLREWLGHNDPVVRQAAALSLGELMPAGGAAALVDAYEFGRADGTYVARAAALAALAAYGAAAAAEPLRAAFEDSSWAVRVRAAALLASLDPEAEVSEAIRPAPGGRPPTAYEAPALTSPTVSPHAFIDTDKGTIEIELAVIDAPLTADNFMELARKGFFDGVTFHRVVPNFVVQAGDPRGDGDGGPGYTIRDELNQRPYLRGTVGMALDWRDTAGSQFFITHSPQPHLDAAYTAFGYVVAGMDVVDRLEPGDVIRRVRMWDGVQPFEP
jgi:cyclophilin family peptidyl-prolyl cis-trans isomerase/HEAT repeat protein